MFTFLRRAAFAVPLLLALASSGRAAEGVEHLFAGNPTGAVADRVKADNFLLKKRQYALSYNNGKGTPNWVSWQLSRAWLGKTRRGNPFAPDTSLPRGLLSVRPNDYRSSGFDRGHMCPAGDRSVSREDMDATFLMTNIVPQAPDCNRITWEHLESYCRDQARDRDRDLYIVAGPAGRGGIGTEGPRDVLRAAKGSIVVPAKCWKVVLVLPTGTADASKVTVESARAFAVIMPYQQGLEHDWRKFAVKVAEVEKLTGFTFFDKLPRDVADDLRSREPQTRARSTATAKEEPRKTGKAGDGKGLELAEFKEGCVIGNRKSKVYHIPGGEGYRLMTKSKNAVFFRDTKDAEKAGYRAAKR